MLLIFDLDGTLIDSRQDLAIATNATREHFGMPPLPADLVQSYVGNGAAMLVRRAMGEGVSDHVIDGALRYFLQFYRAHSLQHTRLYKGVAEAVEHLAAANHKLAVLTNKPRKISVDILDALGIRKYFFEIYGGDSFAAKKPDPVGINSLRTASQSGREGTWMIGDSGVDIQTARNARVPSCGVEWGFKPEDFLIDPPDRRAQSPEDWLHLVKLEA